MNRTRREFLKTTALTGAALGAAAGVMVGLFYGAVRFDMGFIFMIKAFAAAILGGIGSIRGALVGALLVGLVDTLGRAFLPVLLRPSTCQLPDSVL